MTGVDLLGDDGRKALNACVKVSIFSTLSQPSTSAGRSWWSLACEAPDAATGNLTGINVMDILSNWALAKETGVCELEALLQGARRQELIVELREYSQTEATFGDETRRKKHEIKDRSAKIYQFYDRGKDTQEERQESERLVDERQESKRLVDERRRTELGSECATASGYFNIGTGSGFILHNHFIVTSKHVLKTYDEMESHQIRISNAVIGELPCKVVYQDKANDLALLYCLDLNLEKSGIRPLHLSSQVLLPGKQIFSLGYPMGYAGDTALFVTGDVSEKTLSIMMFLNCPLNSGNSGGPVMCRVNNGQLKVVGIVTQKPFKEVLTLEERNTIEKIQKSLQTSVVNPQPHLILKLYDILKTHSLLDLSNALPGYLVIEFIRNSTGNYEGEHKEELAEIIEWSEEL